MLLEEKSSGEITLKELVRQYLRSRDRTVFRANQLVPSVTGDLSELRPKDFPRLESLYLKWQWKIKGSTTSLRFLSERLTKLTLVSLSVEGDVSVFKKFKTLRCFNLEDLPYMTGDLSDVPETGTLILGRLPRFKGNVLTFIQKPKIKFLNLRFLNHIDPVTPEAFEALKAVKERVVINGCMNSDTFLKSNIFQKHMTMWTKIFFAKSVHRYIRARTVLSHWSREADVAIPSSLFDRMPGFVVHRPLTDHLDNSTLDEVAKNAVSPRCHPDKLRF